MNTQTQTIFDSWITYPSIFIKKTSQSDGLKISDLKLFLFIEWFQEKKR